LHWAFRRRRRPQADSFNRMLDGSPSKEPPRPYSEAGTHQHKQVGMVKVPSGDGFVCVCHCNGREENARGNQIWFHQRTVG
jgi:hypothetical protein